MPDLRKKLIRLAYENPDLRDDLVPLLREASGQRVTIYYTGAVGNIVKTEGSLVEVSKSGVRYIPKRGRREQMIMTYYSHFIMVVEGWGKPDPDSAFVPMDSSTPGVEVSRGKYRYTDPRWITDFMDAVGDGLRPIVLFEDGKLKFDKSEQ